MPVVNFYTFINDFTKLLHFLYCLFIPFFHLFDNFQWPMFLAKHTIRFIPIFTLNFHTIVVSSSAFYMETYKTSRCLALHTSTLLFKTDDTIQVEPFFIESV